MSNPGIGEKRDEIGRGSDQVRMFVSDTLIRVGHDATVRELARRMAAEGVGALVVTEGDQFMASFPSATWLLQLLPGRMSIRRPRPTSTAVDW